MLGLVSCCMHLGCLVRAEFCNAQQPLAPSDQRIPSAPCSTCPGPPIPPHPTLPPSSLWDKSWITTSSSQHGAAEGNTQLPEQAERKKELVLLSAAVGVSLCKHHPREGEAGPPFDFFSR